MTENIIPVLVVIAGFVLGAALVARASWLVLVATGAAVRNIMTGGRV